MSVWTKFATIFVCLVICALSLSLIPRAQKTRERVNRSTPVLLRDSQPVHWLLV
jgi:hypothetical protein